MATTTLALIRASSISQGGFKSTDTRLTTAVWLDIINRSLRQTALDNDWYWLRSSETLTTTAGTGTLTPGATFLRTRSITHQDVGTPLALRDVSELDRITTQGRPVLYDVDNSTMIVRPIPDRAYLLTHRFIRTEVVLAADGDSPLLPLEMSEGVILYAVMLAHEFIRDQAQAAQARTGYTSWLRRVTNNSARSLEPFHIRVRPGSLF